MTVLYHERVEDRVREDVVRGDGCHRYRSEYTQRDDSPGMKLSGRSHGAWFIGVDKVCRVAILTRE